MKFTREWWRPDVKQGDVIDLKDMNELRVQVPEAHYVDEVYVDGERLNVRAVREDWVVSSHGNTSTSLHITTTSAGVKELNKAWYDRG